MLDAVLTAGNRTRASGHANSASCQLSCIPSPHEMYYKENDAYDDIIGNNLSFYNSIYVSIFFVHVIAFDRSPPLPGALT